MKPEPTDLVEPRRRHWLRVARAVGGLALLAPLAAAMACGDVSGSVPGDIAGINPQPEPPQSGMSPTVPGMTVETTTGTSGVSMEATATGNGTITEPPGDGPVLLPDGTVTGATAAAGSNGGIPAGGAVPVVGAGGAASVGGSTTSSASGGVSASAGAGGAGGDGGMGGEGGAGGGAPDEPMVSMARCEGYVSAQLECFSPLLVIDGVIDDGGQVSGGYFADAACSEPLGAIAKATGVPALMRGVTEQASVSCLFEVGDPFAGQLYIQQDGTCTSVASSAALLESLDLYRVGDAFSGSLCVQ